MPSGIMWKNTDQRKKIWEILAQQTLSFLKNPVQPHHLLFLMLLLPLLKARDAKTAVEIWVNRISFLPQNQGLVKIYKVLRVDMASAVNAEDWEQAY